MFALDLQIFNFIHQLAGHNRLLDLLAIFFADYSGYIMILIAAFLIFSSKNWKTSFYNLSFISLALLISRGIFTETIRFFFFRVRPFVGLGFTSLITPAASEASFPSGHASGYFALAFALYYLGFRRWSYAFMLVFVLMGVARVFVGVHWPSDIVGGILTALLSAFIVYKALPQNKI